MARGRSQTTGPMVTLVSGQISCTARAMMCAQSWRTSSSASAVSFAVTMPKPWSASIGIDRSLSAPSMRQAIAALASDFEMSAATSAPVVPDG